MAPYDSRPEDAAEPGFLIIGRLIKPHGIRGEMRAAVHTELPERFEWLEYVYLARDPSDTAPERIAVRSVRFHKGNALLRLGDYQTRDELEILRGMWLLVPMEEAIPLDEGELFHHDLKDLHVITEDGESLGVLVEVLETGANEVFIVNGPRGEVLLPNIQEVVLRVNREAGTMIVHLLPGLLND